MRNFFFSILLVFLLGTIPYKVYSDNNILQKDIQLYFSNIDESDINSLIESGMAERYPSSPEDFKFIPDISYKKEIFDSIKKINFNIAAECLFFIPYKEENKDSRKNLLTDSFTIATNIEKLKGIKYYSVSHKSERILFENAEILEGRVSYPITKVPLTHSIIAQIQDTTFGNNKYKIEYNSYSGFLVLKMINIERLSLGFIPVVGKEALLFYIIIIPGEEGLFLYSNGISKTVDSDFIKKRVTQSVYNRVIALYNWFKESYNNL